MITYPQNIQHFMYIEYHGFSILKSRTVKQPFTFPPANSTDRYVQL